MNLDNCPRCGRLFAKGYRDVCPNCVKDIDREYDKCAAYLKENRRCNIHELSEATEVSIRQISRFIREGRISIAHHPNMLYPCDKCGEPIREHTMCLNCRTKLAREVEAAADEKKRPDQHTDTPTGAYRIIRHDQ